MSKNEKNSDDKIELMKIEGTYDEFCTFIASRVFAFDLDEQGMVEAIRTMYPWAFKNLGVKRFKKWLIYYPEIREAYDMSQQALLGKAAVVAYKKMKDSLNDPKDNITVFRLMDRLSALSSRTTASQRTQEISKQSQSMINNFFAEADRFSPEELSEEALFEDMDDEEETL